MENKEIMTTTENAVEAATEEIVSFEPSKLTVGLGIGAGVVAIGGLAYKFLIKPFIDKRKAIKVEQEIIDAEDTVNEEVEE